MRPLPTTGSAALLCIALLASCSTQGTYRQPADDAPAATILGEDRPFTGFLDPLSSQPETFFLSVDEDTLSRSAWSGYPKEIRVLPGLHHIGVRGRVYLNGDVIATGDGEIAHTFAADERYQVRTLLLQGGRVGFELEPAEAAK